MKKYFIVIFVLATLVGVLHHHADMQVHNDCKICIVQSNIVDGDTPAEVFYLTDVDTDSEALIVTFQNPHKHKKLQKLHSRAPPKIS